MRGGCCLTHLLPYDPHHHGTPLPARAPQRYGPSGKEEFYPSPTDEAIHTESGEVTPQNFHHPGKDEFGQLGAVVGRDS